MTEEHKDTSEVLLALGLAAIVIVLFLLCSTPVKANTSLSKVVEPLASKVQELLAACPGSRVVSTVDRRPNRSYHPSGRAVDMSGNAKCLYANLKGWKGGYSVDYSRVKHVHISYGPREMGLRFAHGYGKARYGRVAVAHAAPNPIQKNP